MATEKSLALVLRVTEFSETSCVGLFFTREFGTLPLIAKGAKRPKSPFEAALDVLAVCRLVFLHKSSAMGILTEAKLERRFRNRRQDLDWLYAAFYVVELLKSLLEEGDPHPELFDLAVRTLAELDWAPSDQQSAEPKYTNSRTQGIEHRNRPGNEQANETVSAPASATDDSKLTAGSPNNELNDILLRFEVGLLKYLGHFPLLTQCVGCGRERTTENEVTFGLQAGGVLCPKCRITTTNRIQVSTAGIRHLLELSHEFDGIEKQKDQNSETDGEAVSTIRSDRILERHGEYRRVETTASTGTVVDQVKTQLRPLETDVGREIRRLINQYLTVLLGHEPRVMRFLGKLSRLDS